MNKKGFDAILVLVGTVTSIPGFVEILFGLTGANLTWGVISFGGNFNLWRGLTLLASGALFIFAIDQTNRTQKRAQAMLASSMIWIVGGIEVLSRVLDSITGGQGAWFSTAGEFFSYYAGPFPPSIFLMPISLLLALLIVSEEKSHE